MSSSLQRVELHNELRPVGARRPHPRSAACQSKRISAAGRSSTWPCPGYDCKARSLLHAHIKQAGFHRHARMPRAATFKIEARTRLTVAHDHPFAVVDEDIDVDDTRVMKFLKLGGDARGYAVPKH
eukprot:5532561-Pleurochrysis_carterae.AAC.1